MAKSSPRSNTTRVNAYADGLASDSRPPAMPDPVDPTNLPLAKPVLGLDVDLYFRCCMVTLPVVVIAVLSCAATIDFPVATWVHLEAPQWLRSTASAITDIGKSTFFIVALLIITLGTAAAKKWVWMNQSLWILLSFALAGVVSPLFKFFFGRARPSMQVDDTDRWTYVGHYGFYLFETGYKFNGFPSGHSMTAGLIAGAGLLMRPKLWPLWVGFGLLVATTRVLTNAHYIGDTLAGLWLGMTIPAFMAKIWKDRHAGKTLE